MRHGTGTAAAVVTGCLGVLLAAGPGPARPVVSDPAVPAPAASAPGPAGRLHADGPPPGHTGGFDEPTCHACHNAFPLGIDGRVRVDGLPDPYEPGASYDLVVHLRSDGMERAGFQTSIRILEGPDAGTAAGTVEAVDDQAVVREDGNVTYVQHAPGAAWTDGAESVTWTFTWTAPDTDAPPVVLHLAANSADGDESPFGDIVYTLEKVSRPGEGAR